MNAERMDHQIPDSPPGIPSYGIAWLDAGDTEKLSKWDGNPAWSQWRNKTGGSFLHEPRPHGHRVVPFLLAQGADIHLRDSHGKAPIHRCIDGVRAFRVEWFRSLLAGGADPHALDAEGRGSFYFALRCKEPSLIDDLADCGVRPSEKDMVSLGHCKSWAVAEAFLKTHGSSFGKEQRTQSFLTACSRGNWAVAIALHAHGVDLGCTFGGKDALAWACAKADAPRSFLIQLMTDGLNPDHPHDCQNNNQASNAWMVLDHWMREGGKTRSKNAKKTRDILIAGRHQNLEAVLKTGGQAPRPGRRL